MEVTGAVTGHRIEKCGRAFALNAWKPGQDVVLGPLIAIDTETELIVDHHFPDLVLLQVTAGAQVDLVSYEDAPEYMRLLLRYNPDSTYVFVNAAYDMGVLNMPALYDKVDDGCIVDLMDRYKLWEISERGYVRKPASLAGMSRNVLGLRLKKDDELRLMFTRDKNPSLDQLVYGADDVIATWLLGEKMPKMPTENDSQVMGSIVLDAISRNGMLVDREHFDKKLAEFTEKYERDLDYLEMRGYNPLLGKPSTHVLADGLAALGIEELPERTTATALEYILYKSLLWADLPLEDFKQKLKQWMKEADDEECELLSVKDAVEEYAKMLAPSYANQAKLKRDQLELATKHVKTLSVGDVLHHTKHIRINPFKGNNRKRLGELVRGLLDEHFVWDDGINAPMKIKGFGLKEMARDSKLCPWPMASVLRDLFKAKAGTLRSIPEFSIDEFVKHINSKKMWYGDYSTMWKECLKPEAFMQTRLLAIEQNNPGIRFPRTDGGEDGKNKKIQVSSKDRWIFKKYGIEDELIERYISYKHNEKLISTYLNPAYIKEDGRVRTRFENYVRTGRTSSSRPNVQNVPGKDGIRQMYVPASMHLLASIDYSQLELCGLAQHCYVRYGQSRLGDLINAKIDVHSWFGGRTMGLVTIENDYDGSPESRDKVVEVIDAVPDKERGDAKAANFGYPGGMSAETFLKTQRGFGNTEMTIEEAEDLRTKWFAAFPEMDLHMNPKPDVVTDEDRQRFKNPNLRLCQASNILGVTRRKCSFNSACNYPFQSLAALGAKRAMWAVWRWKNGKYVKHMVNFIHDELLFELPVETAADDVIEIQRVMEDAMKTVMPDVRIEAEGCLMERWDKKAKPVFDEFGNLTVWRPEAAK